jgi:DNA repair protein RecO (recombination protein O)
MLIKSRGIVFRTVKYGESSVIADIFTEHKGVHTFIAGGVRAAKSRMPFGLFQPMTIVDLVAYFKDQEQSMQRIKEIKAAEVYQTIPFDIKKGAVAMFMAEICRKCIRETEENRDLFDFLLDQLLWLDRTEHPIANLHLFFLVHLSAQLGFQPVGVPSGTEMFFDMKEGIFESVPPMNGLYMEPECTQHLLWFLETTLEECHQMVFAPDARKALLKQLLKFYQLHIPAFGEVHTPEILEMVF